MSEVVVMAKITLPKGTLVSSNGFPLLLTQDTEVEANAMNVPHIMELLNAKQEP